MKPQGPGAAAGRQGGGPRRRMLTLFAASLALLLLAVAVVQEAGVSAGRERGIDVSTSYVAGGVWREGLGDRLYDQRLEAARHAAINLPGFRTDLPFITPPLTAVVAAPARLLGPDLGLHAMSVLAVLALVGALLIAARAGPRPAGSGPGLRLALLLGLGAIPTLPLLLMGQWDGAAALGVAAAYAAWRRDRALVAGLALALGVGLAKPHLGLGLAAYVLGRREGRAALGAAAGLVGLGVASVVLVGPRACAGFFGALRLSLAHSAPASTLGASGFAASWLGDGQLATGVALAISAAALLTAVWLGSRSRLPGRLEPTLAGAVAMSLLATPHLLSHDLVVLAPAFVWCAAWALARRADRGLPLRLPAGVVGLWLVVDLAAFADLGNAAPAPPGRVVPVALAGCGLLALLSVRGRVALQSGSGSALGSALS